MTYKLFGAGGYAYNISVTCMYICIDVTVINKGIYKLTCIPYYHAAVPVTENSCRAVAVYTASILYCLTQLVPGTTNNSSHKSPLLTGLKSTRILEQY